MQVSTSTDILNLAKCYYKGGGQHWQGKTIYCKRSGKGLHKPLMWFYHRLNKGVVLRQLCSETRDLPPCLVADLWNQYACVVKDAILEILTMDAKSCW